MEGMPTSRLTPHRVSLCILVQLYVRPRQLSYAYLPSGVRQQLALFLLHDLKGCERFSEPSLEELRDRLQQEIPGGGEALSQQLLSRLFSFNCPDDLFTFFLGGQGGVRDLLAPVSPTASPEADNERLHVDLTSTLGQFLRRSLLDFNALSFEGACRLLNDIEAYRHAVAEERGKVLQPSTGLARKGIGDIEFEDFEEGDEGEDDEYDDVLGDENEDDPDGIGDGDEVEDGVEDVDPWEDDDTEDEFGFRRESAPFMDEGRPIGRGYGLSHLAIGAARNRWRAGGAGRSERSGNIAAKAGLRKGGSSWAGSEGGGSRRASGKPPVMDGGFSFAFGKGMGGGYGEAESPRKVSVFPRTLAQLDSYLREKAVSIEREIGRVPMTALDEQLDELERLSPEMPKIHYLRYLNCLHHGDYPGAMDSLHRYFDYSAGQGGSILAAAGGGVGGGPGGAIGGAAGGGPGGGQGPGGGPLSINDTSVGRFQAALLSLGSMHVQFGHVREALQALNETVRIAQQNNDDVCLAHALGSLCHLLSNAVGLPDVSGAVGGGGRGIESSPRMQIQEQQQQELLVFQLLKQCLRRAQELRLPHLVAFSRLALAKFHMTHVHRLPPIGSQRPAASGGLGSYPIDVCKYLRLSALHYDVLGVSALMPAPAGPGVGLRGLHMPGGDMYGRPPPIGPMNVPGAPGGVSTSAAASAMAAAAAAAAGSGGRLGPVAGSVAKLAGTAHLLRAASWEIYGSASSARASALIHAYCYGDVASACSVDIAGCV